MKSVREAYKWKMFRRTIYIVARFWLGVIAIAFITAYFIGGIYG